MVNIALKELQNSLNIWVNRLVMKQFAAQPPPFLSFDSWPKLNYGCSIRGSRDSVELGTRPHLTTIL